MEHTNPIIIKILKNEYSDYPENDWHYKREYKMMQAAIDAQQLSSKAEGKTFTNEDVVDTFRNMPSRYDKQPKVEGEKTPLEIINQVEPNGELLTTEQVIQCMEYAQQQQQNSVSDDMEMILNRCLNDAMCKLDRIQNPNSNKIAEFITKWMHSKLSSPAQQTKPKGVVSDGEIYKIAKEYSSMLPFRVKNDIRETSFIKGMKAMRDKLTSPVQVKQGCDCEKFGGEHSIMCKIYHS